MIYRPSSLIALWFRSALQGSTVRYISLSLILRMDFVSRGRSGKLLFHSRFSISPGSQNTDLTFFYDRHSSVAVEPNALSINSWSGPSSPLLHKLGRWRSLALAYSWTEPNFVHYSLFDYAARRCLRNAISGVSNWYHQEPLFGLAMFIPLCITSLPQHEHIKWSDRTGYHGDFLKTRKSVRWRVSRAIKIPKPAPNIRISDLCLSSCVVCTLHPSPSPASSPFQFQFHNPIMTLEIISFGHNESWIYPVRFHEVSAAFWRGDIRRVKPVHVDMQLLA